MHVAEFDLILPIALLLKQLPHSSLLGRQAVVHKVPGSIPDDAILFLVETNFPRPSSTLGTCGSLNLGPREQQSDALAISYGVTAWGPMQLGGLD